MAGVPVCLDYGRSRGTTHGAGLRPQLTWARKGNLQATTQEPGTEAWLFSCSGKEIASCRCVWVLQGYCACVRAQCDGTDGQVTKDEGLAGMEVVTRSL